MVRTEPSRERTSIGNEQLDAILNGGLVPQRSYLVRGGPGVGKTTLGFHFLAAGVAAGEKVLLITLGEPEQQLIANAAASGIDHTDIEVLDLSPTSEAFRETGGYDIFTPAEVEREPLTAQLIAEVERVAPTRVFLDAMTQLRYLSCDPFQFRRQSLSLLRFLTEKGATVLFTSEAGVDTPDDDLRFLADGVIELVFENGERKVGISKLRGSGFIPGMHSLRLTDQGMRIAPILQPSLKVQAFAPEPMTSGISQLDDLLGGGIERGTITIITGPTGVGKTTIGLQLAKEAAERGERSVVYAFEEAKEILLARSEKIGLPVRRMLETGKLEITKVEPLEYTADEFALRVRRDVEERDTRIVMVDSLAGYRLSLPSNDVVSHIHALGKYLANLGVTVILINELEAITGDFRATEVGVSYLADNIIFLRYLEVRGEMRRAIGVLKKRLSGFEKTLRALEITSAGLEVGEPLFNLRGILSGIPELVDEEE